MELFNFLWYIVRKTVKKERNLAELLELYTHGLWNLMVLKLLRVCFKCLTNTLQNWILTREILYFVLPTYQISSLIVEERRILIAVTLFLKFWTEFLQKCFFCCDTYIIQFSFGWRFGWYIPFSYLHWIWRDSGVKLSQNLNIFWIYFII